MTILDEVAAMTVADVASRCGLAPGTCPACRSSTRAERDRRPAVLVTADGGGWRCLRCGAGGGTLRWLLAYAPDRPIRVVAREVLGGEAYSPAPTHDQWGIPLAWWRPYDIRRRDDVRRPWLPALRRVAADAERTGELAVGLALEAWAAGCPGDWALDTAREYVAAGGEVVAVAARWGVDL